MVDTNLNFKNCVISTEIVKNNSNSEVASQLPNLIETVNTLKWQKNVTNPTCKSIKIYFF